MLQPPVRFVGTSPTTFEDGLPPCSSIGFCNFKSRQCVLAYQEHLIGLGMWLPRTYSLICYPPYQTSEVSDGSSTFQKRSKIWSKLTKTTGLMFAILSRTAYSIGNAAGTHAQIIPRSRFPHVFPIFVAAAPFVSFQCRRHHTAFKVANGCTFNRRRPRTFGQCYFPGNPCVNLLG